MKTGTKRFLTGIAMSLFFIGSVICDGTVPVAAAQSEPNFKGKTVRIVIGTATGGGVDLYARLIAQFLGKHLAGEPVVLVQNMPGGSSLVAANYVYNTAKPDGLTFGALQGGAYLDQLLGHGAVK